MTPPERSGHIPPRALPTAFIELAGAAGIRLGDAVPLLNGQPAPAGAPTTVVRPVTGAPERFQLALPLMESHEPPPGPLSFGVRLRVTGAHRWLRMGYHSWDGSAFQTPDAEPEPANEDNRGSSEQFGFAVTQLASDTGFLQIGFVRHDRLQHRFRLHRRNGVDVLDIEVLWDRRPPFTADPHHFVSEAFVVTTGAAVEPLLRGWADTVAVSGPTPRSSEPVTGWCSWYNLYGSITEDNLLQHLAGVRRACDEDQLPMRVFQIDDGFTPEMGDWLQTRPTFPRGMKPLLREIRDAGFTPGMWIAPFLVGNRSDLYTEHPDWVVIDRLTDAPYVCMQFYGEFRWHKRSEEYYLLDTTHPEAMAYLRRVMRTWRHDWGVEYVKTDFMYYAAEHGPDRVRRYRQGDSRVEVFVEALQAIREELGDAVWLGCGIPLWMSIGLVDAVRIGRDVGAEWDTGVRAEQHFENLALRSFAQPRLWLADPDCILLRHRYHHLTDAEINILALTAGMTGGVTMTSDDLGTLSPERRQLWAFTLSLADGHCTYPTLGQTTADGLLVQWRPERRLLHVVNPGPAPRPGRIPWSRLGLAGPPQGVRVMPGDRPLSAAEGSPGAPLPTGATNDETGLQLHLAPHTDLLLRLD